MITPSNRSICISIIIIIALVILTYSSAINNDFVGWDDNDYVINNPLVRNEKGGETAKIFSTVVSLNYHPLTILSLRLNNNRCIDCPNKISARPFIINNIVLHGLNTILVFILIFILFRKNLVLAFLVAAVFGVHPMHVESVAWISGRKDVLNSFFFLSGLIFYIRYIVSSGKRLLWLAGSFLLFVLAVLSKATAVIFPIVALLTGYFYSDQEKENTPVNDLKRFISPKSLMPLMPFFAVSVFFGMMAYNIQSGNNFLGMMEFLKEPKDAVNTVAPFSVLQRAQIGSYGFFVYLFKFFFPVNQSPFYPYPDIEEFNHGSFALVLWLVLLLMISTIGMVLFSLNKRKFYFFTFGFYFLNLLLVLQFISVGRAIIAERYTYLPYIGAAIVPAYFISRSGLKTERIFLTVAAVFIVTMLIVARKQVGVWKDSESLWTQVIKRHPDLELARSARGKYFYMQSSHAADSKRKMELEDKALEDFRIAIAKKTTTADVYEGTGVILQSRNEFKKALTYLDLAVKLNPDKGRTYFNRAVVLDQLNQKEQAIKDYETALRLSPEMTFEILKNRSVLYIETGNYNKAIRDLNELVRIDGKDYTNFYNRAFCKVMLKDYRGAVIDYKIVLLLNPGDKETPEQLKFLEDYLKKNY
jgi:tetratricopeptide (TPR) repeat protein